MTEKTAYNERFGAIAAISRRNRRGISEVRSPLEVRRLRQLQAKPPGRYLSFFAHIHIVNFLFSVIYDYRCYTNLSNFQVMY
jgi:hypothetical protein